MIRTICLTNDLKMHVIYGAHAPTEAECIKFCAQHGKNYLDKKEIIFAKDEEVN